MDAKITTKTNHDSLWVKATLASGEWVKLVINRRGVAVQRTGEATVPYVRSFETTYASWKETKGGTYGSLVANVAEAWALV